MGTDWLDARRFGLMRSADGSKPATDRTTRLKRAASTPSGSSSENTPPTEPPTVGEAIGRTRAWLLSQQYEDGYWVAELEGDTILESEYLLLLAFLDRLDSEIARKAGEQIRRQQLPTGGWSNYPSGPIEISASVKAYLVLKLLGDDPDADHMLRAKLAIRAAGGAERVNSFTRYYLALLGLIGYHQCPAVPPELMLIPKWAPFNIYDMSSWSRTIVVPLSILWAYRPTRPLEPRYWIEELFLNGSKNLPVTMDTSDVVDDLKASTRIDWERFFRRGDRVWKAIENLGIKPFRKLAVRRAREWMLKRFRKSDGLGAIFPPIIWSVVALKCLGYAEDSPEVTGQLAELESLFLEDDQTLRIQPCKSPVWDTAIVTLALREAGVPARHPSMRRAADWLLSKQTTERGDWAEKTPEADVGGWYFEFNNEFYPDIDDTIMVSMALRKCLPMDDDPAWTARLLEDGWTGETSDRNAVAILAGETDHPETLIQDIEDSLPILRAIRRGVRWVYRMQCRNGGWAAFDRDNTREIYTRVPFADHNAMIDPPTADISARVLEMIGRLDLPNDTPEVQRCIRFVWSEQELDAAWYGRWGVHYIYGTWQCLVGLTQAGVSTDDYRIRRAAGWLKTHQQPSGGWGESPEAYDNPALRGRGVETASQTAWAILGLIAAGEGHSFEVRRGIDYLLRTQNPNGTWTETEFTGTGFPRVFYLRYHLYPISFPLMALAEYARLNDSEG